MKCVQCKKTATIYNKQGMPVCSSHLNVKVKVPNCPNCGVGMAMREGKWGKFWGCVAFPMCDGLRKI